MEPMPILRSPGIWSFKLEESSGYVRGFRAGPNGYERRYEHQVVMERKLGRPLLEGENVHHVNGIRHDNRPENLELWSVKQPRGQRVDEKTEWAIEWLRTYRPEVLA